MCEFPSNRARSLVSDGAIDEFVREGRNRRSRIRRNCNRPGSLISEEIVTGTIRLRDDPGGGYIICTGCWMSSYVDCIPIGWNVTGWREPSAQRKLLAVAERFSETNWNGFPMPEEGNYEADPVIADRVKKGRNISGNIRCPIFGKFFGRGYSGD